MAKHIPEEDLKRIEEILKGHPNGVDISFISDALGDRVPNRTLRYRLHYLADQGRIVTAGQRRGLNQGTTDLLISSIGKAAEPVVLGEHQFVFRHQY